MPVKRFDIIIIGSGPAGTSAAEAALPRPHLYGFLTAIQIAAFSGLLYYAAVFLRRGKRAP